MEKRPILTSDQEYAVKRIQSGTNILLHGAGGTGKSFLINYLKTYILPKYTTFATGSTGIAAVNIGGCTIHSFSGIGLGEG